MTNPHQIVPRKTLGAPPVKPTNPGHMRNSFRYMPMVQPRTNGARRRALLVIEKFFSTDIGVCVDADRLMVEVGNVPADGMEL